MSADRDLDRVYRSALRALVTPGLYGADLESSPLIEHPTVLAAIGPDMSRQSRARAFIRILEEVIDKRLQPHDQVAAKALFALGEWAGRPVTERHRKVAR